MIVKIVPSVPDHTEAGELLRACLKNPAIKT